MNERDILNKINQTAEMPVKADFADLMSRINAQTEEERAACREEALALLSEANAPQKISPSRSRNRGLIGIAAALLITVGLGTVLIAASIGGFAKSESAPMEATDSAGVGMFADEAADGEYDNFAHNEESAQSATPPESQEIFPDGENGDPQNSVSDSDVSASDVTKYIECRVEQLEMDISLPANAYITDRTVSHDFELLEKYDMSAAQLEANYKNRDIYYNAVWYDEYADATEIVITMHRDATSKGIYNLKTASKYDLSKLRELYLSYGDNGLISGAEYFDVSEVPNGQALFFRALGTVDNDDSRSNHLQYMTIINGCRIEITLIEHFGVENELSGEEPQKVAEKHEDMMSVIISSARWDSINNGFFQRYKGFLFFAAIAVVGFTAIAVSAAAEYRKKKLEASDSAQECIKEEEKADDSGKKTDISVDASTEQKAEMPDEAQKDIE